MFEVAFALMFGGCIVACAVDWLIIHRLNLRIRRLEKCLLTAAERLGEPQHE